MTDFVARFQCAFQFKLNYCRMFITIAKEIKATCKHLIIQYFFLKFLKYNTQFLHCIKIIEFHVRSQKLLLARGL